MTEGGGILFNIQRAALDDGPGVRTVLFFKGCPLSCPWCHNPESQRAEIELLARVEQCAGCGACAAVCPVSAVENARVDRAKCRGCGACAGACRHDALEMAGKFYTARDAAREALLDKAFFKATGGGVTLSGGEPLWQHEFALDVLKALKAEGADTCVETCCVCADGVIERFIPYTDHWLTDIKFTDENTHRNILGVTLDSVLKNIYILKDAGARVTFRCPVIPGINDDDAHFAAVRKLARDAGASAVDILPYHRLGCDKYYQLGRVPPLGDVPAPDPSAVAKWEDAVRKLAE